MAFVARLDEIPIGNGLFVGPDPDADKVIFAGAPVFGSTARDHFISNVAMNNAGQIAFRYTLANDTSGIALATPVIVSTSPGDFDHDGDVDGRDFLVGQRNPCVDNLTDWQSNYGTGTPLFTAATAVAEPATEMLLLGLLALGSSRIGKRCVFRN